MYLSSIFLQVTFQQEWTAIILCTSPQATKKKVYLRLKQFCVSSFVENGVFSTIWSNFTGNLKKIYYLNIENLTRVTIYGIRRIYK